MLTSFKADHFLSPQAGFLARKNTKTRLPFFSPQPNLVSVIEKNTVVFARDTAAIFQGRSMSYDALGKRAQLVASHLLKRGVKPGDAVGIFFERHLDLLPAILGILSVGGVVVLQDARISQTLFLRHIVEDSALDMVITLDKFAEKIAQVSSSVELLSMDSLFPLAPAERACLDKKIKNSSLKADQAAFYVYTSGTTGKPKGVVVTHQNLLNILLSKPACLGMSPGKTVSQIMNIAFDMALWETMGALVHGATLHIRGKSIQEAVSQSHITVATPSILSNIDLDKCPKLETVAVAGEPCPLALAKKWSARVHFYNAYGPTEASIINTIKKISPSDTKITIGKPTQNNRVYVLDSDKNKCKVNEVGEIWAAGRGVTQGYLNRPELTEERYVNDVFAQDGSLMFNTRDLGFWNREGELEILGRSDRQVKIKGFRVEIDSVSSLLEEYAGCESAYTLVSSQNELTSFVRGRNLCSEKLFCHLKQRLPYYAMPKEIVILKQFPQTERGKVDEKHLLSLINTSRTLVKEGSC